MRQTSFPGSELREQREKMGLSVYEAFRKTRVPGNYIEALERGQVHALPATCYGVGFLKTYCLFLGLNPDRYVDSFRACSRPSAVRFLRAKNGGATFRTPDWVHDAMTWAVVTAVLLLGWVTYSVVFQPSQDNADRRVEAGTVDLVAPPPQIEDAGL
jgi:cytoskeletal protein RodZ